RPTLTTMLISTMSSADKLKLPEIRLLTPQENQLLTDLAEDIAQQILGPDWKERQEERRAAMNISFEGKVALVTGAGSGMGLATAKAFAEEKAAVVLADVQEKAILAAAEELVAAGHKALAIPCDVSDDVQVEAMVTRTVAEFGRLDAAFNNAGVMARIA